jgi:hypothetical protein
MKIKVSGTEVNYYGRNYNNPVEISFLNSNFQFRIYELQTIHSNQFYDSVLFENKWFYNVYKLKSTDTLANLYLNYKIGIIKYEKDSISWLVNN